MRMMIRSEVDCVMLRGGDSDRDDGNQHDQELEQSPLREIYAARHRPVVQRNMAVYPMEISRLNDINPKPDFAEIKTRNTKSNGRKSFTPQLFYGNVSYTIEAKHSSGLFDQPPRINETGEKITDWLVEQGKARGVMAVNEVLREVKRVMISRGWAYGTLTFTSKGELEISRRGGVDKHGRGRLGMLPVEAYDNFFRTML